MSIETRVCVHRRGPKSKNLYNTLLRGALPGPDHCCLRARLPGRRGVLVYRPLLHVGNIKSWPIKINVRSELARLKYAFEIVRSYDRNL